jgi:hypothetical protein
MQTLDNLKKLIQKGELKEAAHQLYHWVNQNNVDMLELVNNIQVRLATLKRIELIGNIDTRNASEMSDIKTDLDLLVEQCIQKSLQNIDENSTDAIVTNLKLSNIIVDKDYCNMWNITKPNFLVLSKMNGERLRNTLYRVGGKGTNNILGKRYFMLLKYVEAIYPDNIEKKPHKKRHLEGHWCIIDANGVEKVEFERFSSPFLIEGSCIYSIDNKYYNIETGYLYANSYNRMDSDKFIFLDNKFDNEQNKKGVLKISKLDGTFEVFP